MRVYVYIYIYINSILIDDGDTKGSPKTALILCHCTSMYMYVTSLFSSPLFTEKKTSRLETENRLYMCTFVCMSVTYRHSIYIYIRNPY